MTVVFFAHPSFLGHHSMRRYTYMLEEGMKARGHKTVVLQPLPFFTRLGGASSLKKWLGYIDQFLIFPFQARKRIRKLHGETIFVLTDHALGPWIPLVKNKPHVIHCHDFLAQKSALGEIPENKTKFSGRLYQAFIRNGYTQAKNFISVSKQTREDLHKFLSDVPTISEVVYNGLDPTFTSYDPIAARKLVEKKIGIDLSAGYLLHVGGNQWYKNRSGLIDIYNAFQNKHKLKLPLLLVGAPPTESLKEKQELSPHRDQIYFLSHLEDKVIHLAYAGASMFLFPSLAEGFGWPIAEAMASGCPVITTNEPPMTEVAGANAFFLNRKKYSENGSTDWAEEGARVLQKALELTPGERKQIIENGLQNIARFNQANALDKIEEIYSRIIKK